MRKFEVTYDKGIEERDVTTSEVEAERFDVYVDYVFFIVGEEHVAAFRNPISVQEVENDQV